MGISHGKRDRPLPPEEWRDVPEYGGVIQASSHGRIRRKEQDGSYRIISIIINGGCKNNRHKVMINWKGRRVQHTVLRLVGMAFFPGQLTGKDMVVRHRNGMQWDNTVWNVEILNHRECSRKSSGRRRKSVIVTDADGEPVDIYPSIDEASRATGYSRQTIRDRCNGVTRPKRATDIRFEWG